VPLASARWTSTGVAGSRPPPGDTGGSQAALPLTITISPATVTNKLFEVTRRG
jgi:hypothetical protein